LREVGLINVRIVVCNDAEASLNGETFSPLGMLRTVRDGGIVIIGGGINIAVKKDGEFVSAIKEAGHNLFQIEAPDGTVYYFWSGKESQGGHPIEKGNTLKEIEKKSGNLGREYTALVRELGNEDDAQREFLRRHPGYPFIEWGKGLRDFEDRVSGRSITTRLMQEIQEVEEIAQFGPAHPQHDDYMAIKATAQESDKKGKISNVLNHEARVKHNPVAIRWIRNIGAEVGCALAAFIHAYRDEEFVKRMVLVSGVNENMGKGVVLADSEEDLYMDSLRKGVFEELVHRFNMSEAQAREIIQGIVRSQLTYEREFISYQPSDEEMMRLYLAKLSGTLSSTDSVSNHSPLRKGTGKTDKLSFGPHVNVCSKDVFELPQDRFGTAGVNAIDLWIEAIQESLGINDIAIGMIGSGARFLSFGKQYWPQVKDLDMKIYLPRRLTPKETQEVKRRLRELSYAKGLNLADWQEDKLFGAQGIFDVRFHSFDDLGGRYYIYGYRYDYPYFGTAAGMRKFNEVISRIDALRRIGLYTRRFMESFRKIKGAHVRDIKHLLFMANLLGWREVARGLVLRSIEAEEGLLAGTLSERELSGIISQEKEKFVSLIVKGEGAIRQEIIRGVQELQGLHPINHGMNPEGLPGADSSRRNRESVLVDLPTAVEQFLTNRPQQTPKAVDVIGLFDPHAYRQTYERIKPTLERIAEIATAQRRPMVLLVEDDCDPKAILVALKDPKSRVFLREAITKGLPALRRIFTACIDAGRQNIQRRIIFLEVPGWVFPDSWYRKGLQEFVNQHQEVVVVNEVPCYEGWSAAVRAQLHNFDAQTAFQLYGQSARAETVYEQAMQKQPFFLSESWRLRDEAITKGQSNKDSQLIFLARKFNDPIIVILRGTNHHRMLDNLDARQYRRFVALTISVADAQSSIPVEWIAYRLLTIPGSTLSEVEKQYLQVQNRDFLQTVYQLQHDESISTAEEYNERIRVWLSQRVPVPVFVSLQQEMPVVVPGIWSDNHSSGNLSPLATNSSELVLGIRSYLGWSTLRLALFCRNRSSV
jgi:hypothetical protein